MIHNPRFSILNKRRNLESNVQGNSPVQLPSVPADGSHQEIEHTEILLDELVEILDAELYQYRDLLRLLQAQRESFAASDISSFEENSKQQGTVVLKIKTLEEARKSIVSRLAKYFNLPPEVLTLARLATLVDSQYGERCSAYQKEILSLIKELEDLRENNAYLMKQALHYVSGVLRIFASTHTTDFAYSNNGQLEPKTKKGKYLSGWG